MLQFVCQEKGGEVLRTVRPMQRTIPRILDVLEKMGRVPSMLDPVNPARIFLDPTIGILEVDDVGLLVVSDFKAAEGGAHVHATFWDGRLRGREEMCKSLVTMASEVRRQMVHTAIHQDRKALLAFCRRVGFRPLRQAQAMVVLQFTRD